MAARKKKTPAKKKATTKKTAAKKAPGRKKASGEPSVIEAIRKKYGDSAVMRLSGGVIQPTETISSGSLGVDIATGVGGLPRGRIVECYGPESSGKTTLTLHAIAQAQRRGLACAFVDAEHALDMKYAQQLGVDTAALYLSQPDHGEQALDITEMYARSNEVGIVVVDSVAALVPKSELDGEMGDAHMGKHARLMSQAMRKLAGVVAKSRTIVLFTNQTRMKIGVMFGSPVTTTGGNALKFYASMRLKVNRIGSLQTGAEDARGIRARVQIVKNKCAPPFRDTEFDILWGKGVFLHGEIVDIGTDLGIIDKAGAWYSFNGKRLGQGRSNVADALAEDTDTAYEIESMIRKHFSLPAPEVAL